MNSAIEYRTLRPGELDQWFDFVAFVFGSKGTPRYYFVAHWYNDPWAHPDSVMVAVAHNDNNSETSSAPSIVGTVRVFKRSMYLRGVSCTFGGIGEVAVHPDYQRRGIATKLLEMSKQHMKTSPLYSQLLVTLSVLHTGTQAPLYEKSGWWNTLARTSFVCGTSTWTVTSADAPSEPESCFILCPPNWSDDQFVSEVSRVYESWCQYHHISGPVCRDSTAYWRRWVARESYAHQCTGLRSLWIHNNDGSSHRRLGAYLIARATPIPSQSKDEVPGNGINTGVDIYIKEFIWDPLLIMLDPITALWQLVGDLVRPHVHTEGLHAPESRGSISVPVKISLPSALLRSIIAALLTSSSTTDSQDFASKRVKIGEYQTVFSLSAPSWADGASPLHATQTLAPTEESYEISKLGFMYCIISDSDAVSQHSVDGLKEELNASQLFFGTDGF